MNTYSIIKWYRRIKSPRIKLLGILTLHLTKRRYLYVLMDPSLACNLRCRMCYFSNPEDAKQLHGVFSNEDIRQIARSVFPRVLKLQIGCGAEPTTYAGLAGLVKAAHERGVPHISLTTNGNLLTRETLLRLADEGLNEMVLSAHGLDKDTYEYMMRNAEFSRFIRLIGDVGVVKEQHPSFQLRLNYTVCADNIDSLAHFQEVFGQVKPDVVQLRPVQDIGSTAYDNYSMKALDEKYEERIGPLIEYCKANHITCLYPERANINSIEHENKTQKHVNRVVEMLPLFHLSPHQGWKESFNPYEETFDQYCRRTHRIRFILKHLVNPRGAGEQEHVTKALNYKID